MDVLRIVGNYAVHSGEIDLTEDGALAPAMFGLLNVVVQELITRQRVTAELYQALPPGPVTQSNGETGFRAMSCDQRVITAPGLSGFPARSERESACPRGDLNH